MPLSRTLGASLLAVAAAAAQAQPIELVPNTLNMFRDTRGANDVGVGQGERFQFGADIVGGSVDELLGATYGPTGFVISQFACNPLAVAPNFCSRSTAFNANRLQPWTLRFTRGTETLEVIGPSLAGTQSAVPFPVSVTLSGSSLTPTVSWQVPDGFVPDGFRVNLYDKNRPQLNNPSAFDVVHSIAISPTSTSYTLPATFNSGLALDPNGSYTINLQMVDTRNDVPFTNNNAQILRRSSSFFAFTPNAAGTVPEVVLPTVVDGVYNFSVAEVGPSSVTFIDPFVAIGYDYATGAGDPNFASVILPDIGDGNFMLEFTDATGAKSVALEDGAQYFFGAGGVSAFRVSGIEVEAGLDPTDATAFITGLTFVTNGRFTGTMTPITQFVPEVPEPSTYGLMALGLLGVAAAARRRRKT